VGRTVVMIIIFILWLIIKPKNKTPIGELTTQNIDSIQIVLDENKTTITDKNDLARICRQLQNLKSSKPERIKINTKVIYLYMFIKQKKVPLRIIYGYYDGIIIEIDNLYYKNDSLNILISKMVQ